MKKLAILVLAVLTVPLSIQAGDSPKEDKKFLGITDCKKDKFDCAWVDPSFSFAGKTIHVEKFEKVCDAPKGDDYGDLHWKNAGEYMQNVFAEQTNDRVEKYKTRFISGGSGDYVMKGQITEFRYPKKGASWGGWIGEAAGSGTIVYDWKIVDKSGKTLAAVHHKILAGASWTLDHRVDNVHNDNMVEFIKEHAK